MIEDKTDKRIILSIIILAVFAVLLLWGAYSTINFSKSIRDNNSTLYYGEITLDAPIPEWQSGSVIGWKIYRFLTNNWLVGGGVIVLMVIWGLMFRRFMHYTDLARARKELADCPDEKP